MPNWGEGYFRPPLGFRYDAQADTQIYGLVSGVLAGTLGEGNAGGFTNDGADVDLDQAYAGIKTKLLGGKDAGGWDVDISGGREKLQIGDGFLIWDGNFDTFSDKIYWLSPRTAFDGAGIVKIENQTTKLTGFVLRSDKHNAHAELAGGDITYSGDWGSVGVLGFHIFDDNGALPRDGMSVVSARAKDLKVPGFENLAFSGEYARQFGGAGVNDFDAYGFYAQAAYTFASLPWSPKIRYRFAKFSGDGNPADTNIKGFDPLFHGFSGPGSWFLGEVVGEYLLFNSNELIHQVHLSASPTESISAGLIYYHFELDKKNYFGTSVTDKNFADELNAYVEWAVNDNLFVAAIAGFAVPNSAAKQAIGNDTQSTIQAYAVIKY